MCLSNVEWRRDWNKAAARRNATGRGRMWKVFKNGGRGSKTGLRFNTFPGCRLKLGRWMTSSGRNAAHVSYPVGYHGFTDLATAKSYAVTGQLIVEVEWRGKLAVGRQEAYHARSSAIVARDMRIPRGWRKTAVRKGGGTV